MKFALVVGAGLKRPGYIGKHGGVSPLAASDDRRASSYRAGAHRELLSVQPSLLDALPDGGRFNGFILVASTTQHAPRVRRVDPVRPELQQHHRLTVGSLRTQQQPGSAVAAPPAPVTLELDVAVTTGTTTYCSD